MNRKLCTCKRTVGRSHKSQLAMLLLLTLCIAAMMPSAARAEYGKAKVKLISRDTKQSVLRLTIIQGRNRQVRRMLATMGYKVVHLIRIGFGNLFLGDLKVGEYRHLERNEVLRMETLIGMS